MFSAFSHTMLYVLDLDRAVSFYRDRLGFEVRFHHPKAYASMYHSSLGFRLDLHPSEAGGRDVGYGPISYFQTTDLDAAIQKLGQLGIKTSLPRSEGGGPRFATFWDSEGNALGVEERPPG